MTADGRHTSTAARHRGPSAAALLEPAPTEECGCTHHAADELDHDLRFGAFEMTSTCPICAETDQLRLCASHVIATLGDPDHSPVHCPVCGHTAPANQFWNTIRRISTPDTDTGSSCRLGQSCIGYH